MLPTPNDEASKHVQRLDEGWSMTEDRATNNNVPNGIFSRLAGLP